MLRTYNDDLQGIAELYYLAEDENNLFAMALWRQWNRAIHFNGGKEPEAAVFIALLERLEKCTDSELETLARV